MNRRPADRPTPRELKVVGQGSRYRVCVIVGTRPEAIKLAPVILELAQHRHAIETVVVSTAQNREMLKQALDAFGIQPNVDLGVAVANKHALADFTARAMVALSSCYAETRPDLVLVQGDGSVVLAAALSAHYLGIPVGHVEAGLRTGNLRNPFPEELNRRMAAVVADLHFAPTEQARDNLLREGVTEDRVVVTGNTIVDAIRRTPRRSSFADQQLNALPWEKRRFVLCTIHRREHVGEPLLNSCRAIAELAAMHTDTHFLFPVHLNPQVRTVVQEELAGIPRVELLEPLAYADLVEVLRRSEFAMTDSGGIQEECATLGRPVLVLRRVTDRPEVIESGFGILAGTETNAIVDHATRLLDDYRIIDAMSAGENPFGDGLAAQRIVQALMRRAPRQAGALPMAEGPALLPTRRAVEL